jgi:hypothetical protein
VKHSTTPTNVLLPAQRSYLETVARHLAPEVPWLEQQHRTETVVHPSGDGHELAVVLERMAKAARDAPPPPREFRLGADAAAALAALPLPYKSALAHLPPQPDILGAFFGVPLRVDPALPPDVIAFEDAHGRRQYVWIAPGPESPPRVAEIAPPWWRRLIGWWRR